VSSALPLPIHRVSVKVKVKRERAFKHDFNTPHFESGSLMHANISQYESYPLGCVVVTISCLKKNMVSICTLNIERVL